MAACVDEPSGRTGCYSLMANAEDRRSDRSMQFASHIRSVCQSRRRCLGKKSNAARGSGGRSGDPGGSERTRVLPVSAICQSTRLLSRFRTPLAPLTPGFTPAHLRCFGIGGRRRTDRCLGTSMRSPRPVSKGGGWNSACCACAARAATPRSRWRRGPRFSPACPASSVAGSQDTRSGKPAAGVRARRPAP